MNTIVATLLGIAGAPAANVLKQLPPPDKEMRAPGLKGRVFPAVGKHEVWDDTDVQGLLAAFPYLRKFGVSDKRPMPRRF